MRSSSSSSTRTRNCTWSKYCSSGRTPVMAVNRRLSCFQILPAKMLGCQAVITADYTRRNAGARGQVRVG